MILLETTDMLDTIQKEAPDVAKAFQGLIEVLKSNNGLDPKTKELVLTALKTLAGETYSISHHIQAAKQFGATKEEIRDTILLTLSVCGLCEAAKCLKEDSESYRWKDKKETDESNGFKRVNLGKITETRLVQSGITSFDMLETLGSERAFILLNTKESVQDLRFLFKLEGAIQGVRSGEITDKRKSELKQFYSMLKMIRFPKKN